MSVGMAIQCGARALLCALLLPVACTGRATPAGSMTVVIQWLDAARADTLVIEASAVPIHGSNVHPVPAGPMALEAYMLGSTEAATLFGWVDAGPRTRLPVFVGVNAVANVLDALRDLPALPPRPRTTTADSQHLTLFFIEGIGDAPRRDVFTRFWASGGARMLTIDTREAMIRAPAIMRVRERDLPDAGPAHRFRFRIRVQAEPALRAAVPLLVYRDSARWIANTLTWNRTESGELVTDTMASGAPGLLNLYLFEAGTT